MQKMRLNYYLVISQFMHWTLAFEEEIFENKANKSGSKRGKQLPGQSVNVKIVTLHAGQVT